MTRVTLLLIISIVTFGLKEVKTSPVFQDDPGFETRIQTVVAGLLDVRTENVNKNRDNPNVSIIDYENQDIVIHENYTGGGKGRFLNDISIIKLRESLKTVFKPVLLPSDDEKHRVKLKGLGWGLYNCKDYSPENLREADGKYIDLATCYEGYAPKDIPESKLCAKFTSEGNSASVAPGDSGGPLVSFQNPSQPVQIGLTSTVSFLKNTNPGETCVNKDTPQVYTRVSSFSQFIMQYAPNAQFVQ
ncbi:unnamed protein product [Allacma fusca]|uniref:Peptidase S1 domain-containing protein n=1 Tax=Allacma fusca TaxID=39272 RepID=A0A8J2PGI8_9HEXA|nr:unnamed protein product [Allacma fusca]